MQEFKPQHKNEEEVHSHFDEVKKQLYVKKILRRIIVLLILIGLILLTIYLVKRPKKVRVSNSEPQKVEVPQEENKEVKEEIPNPISTDPKVPNPSPVKKAVAVPTTIKGGYSGYAYFYDGEYVFSLCGNSQDLLVMRQSPAFSIFVNRFKFFNPKLFENVKIFATITGRTAPIKYGGLGSTYTQGVYIDQVITMDSNKSC